MIINKETGIFVITFTILLTFFTSRVVSQDSCMSLNRAPGKCVTFEECPAYLAILKSPKISASEIRLLQKLTCNYENPKICCPIDQVRQSQPVKSPGPGDTTSFNSKPISSHHHSTSTSTSTSTINPGNVGEDWSIPEEETQSNGGQDKGQNINEETVSPSFKNHRNFHLLPTLEECGNVRSEDHIVGGKDASHGGHPWITRIGYRNTETNEVDYYCSGTIISKRYILTAAHCTVEIDEEYIPEVMRLGEHNTTTEMDCSPLGCSTAQNYKIEKIISHPRYSTEDKFNDIGIIRVDRDIQFDADFIRPICLPFKNEYNVSQKFPTNFNGKKGIVAGWGRTKWNRAEGSTTLQEVFLPMLSNEECQAKYSTRAKISDKQMCAGGLKGRDSCSGDSGGPFILPLSFGASGLKFFQLGVVSFGPVQCGVAGLPGVYSRVTSYFDWILDNMEP